MNAETNQVARPARRYAAMAPTIRPTMAPPIISRAAMRFAVLITGDDVARCETEAATTGKSCGRLKAVTSFFSRRTSETPRVDG